MHLALLLLCVLAGPALGQLHVPATAYTGRFMTNRTAAEARTYLGITGGGTNEVTLSGTNTFSGANTFTTAIVLSGLSTSLVTKVADFTLLSENNTVLVNATSGNLTITLPNAASLPGWRCTVKKIDASVNTVTVATVASQTIDGTTLVISAQYASYTLVSNGANWFIL